MNKRRRKNKKTKERLKTDPIKRLYPISHLAYTPTYSIRAPPYAVKREKFYKNCNNNDDDHKYFSSNNINNKIATLHFK